MHEWLQTSHIGWCIFGQLNPYHFIISCHLALNFIQKLRIPLFNFGDIIIGQVMFIIKLQPNDNHTVVMNNARCGLKFNYAMNHNLKLPPPIVFVFVLRLV